jgi:superfamily II DNA or RNA helicase
MNLRELNLRKSYDSDRDDILNEFYVPALSVSISYERLAGFFSSTSLAVAARGIAGLISNGGRIRLICGAKLSKQDVEAILEAKKDLSDIITENAAREFEDIEALENKFVENHVKGLGWMMANGVLEIKIAVVKDDNDRPLDYQEALKSGIFHQKVGILRNVEGNVVSFSGSDNETASAWIQNIEEFKVFRSWEESQREYLQADVNRFQRFWSGLGKRAEVIDIPDAIRRKLIDIAPNDIGELELSKLYVRKKRKGIKLWDQQVKALDKWLKNGKRCIFEMATGTGKTLAALACLRHLLSEEKKLVTVITCPYSHLIYQWKENIERLDVSVTTVDAFSGNVGWRDILVDHLRDVKNNIINALVILTTHDTFYKDNFKEFLSIAGCKLFLIADEVHGLGSEVRRFGLIEEYDYRLGLSATPTRWFDPEGTKLLLKYFQAEDDTNLFVFSLEDAIKTINPETGETYLTPYEYKPYFTELAEEEINDYLETSQKIAKAYYSSKNEWDRVKYFDLLCFQRQKIIQNASNKYNVFKSILDIIDEVKHCLVYCSPEQIESVQEILNERQIIQHKFTQEEGIVPSKRYAGKSERENILENFSEGNFQVLVAMKCLDEGVDIPQARTSIILASTGNPREYIQRRGRLLRRYPGKKFATIYDIIVFPTLDRQVKITGPLGELEKKMTSLELRRYEEFASVAVNVIECIKVIRDIEKRLNWR